jgi:hypothetical protein
MRYDLRRIPPHYRDGTSAERDGVPEPRRATLHAARQLAHVRANETLAVSAAERQPGRWAAEVPKGRAL